MSFKLRVYIGEKIKDIPLSKNSKYVTIGSSNTDTLKVESSDIIPNHLVFIFENKVWVCQDNAKRMHKNIEDGDVFVLSMNNKIAVAVYSDDIIPQRMTLKQNTKIVIGRAFDCMFHLPDRSVGRQHAEIIVDDLGVTLRDLNSLNGTYLNNKRMYEQMLKDGDVISIGKYNILFKRNTLELCAEEIEATFITKKDIEYPIFNLSPRLRHKTPSDVIEIQDPPNLGNMPIYNWLSFLPMLVSQNAYSAVFPLSSFFSTYLQKRKYKEAEEVRQEKYERYLASVKAKIDKNRDEQFVALEESNHETSRCLDIVTARERTLWERASEDDDFMKVRIGKGDIKVSFQIKFPDSMLKLHSDELECQGEELGKGSQVLEGAPILCDIYHDLSVGVIGDRQKALNVARNMIVQLATTHSYKDLKIVSLFSKRESKEWEFVKWLPHSFSDSRELRYVANDVFNAATLEKIIDTELKNRKSADFEQDLNNKTNKMPFYLFVVSNPELIEESEIANYLDNATVGAGIGVIYVYDELRDLPKSCNVIIDVRDDSNKVFHKSNVGERQKFDIDVFSANKAEIFARSLAPVRLAEKKSASNMPTCVTFLEGYGVKRVEELPVWENWNNDKNTETVAVPLGVKENGEPFIFNMMNGRDFLRHHGTFGLVAGTTGSGKSEMMQSWILSLAVRFQPEYISFIIMDYKGTGLLLPFKDLPHLAGGISNLDGNVRRKIIAIEHELKRREALCDELGIQPNIEEYYRRGFHKTYKPLPRLIIIIDEFAEVKKNHPEFIPVLESIFAKGRSLGFGVIISTQKPSTSVTPNMYANCKFRWCCRVASGSDSKDMLGHTDAVRIKNAGRAYVQVGEDEIYEQIQSFWSGASYLPDKTERISVDTPIYMMDITGKKIQYEIYSAEKRDSAVKEVSAVVEYIKKIAEEHNIQHAMPIWQARIPDKIRLDDLSYNRDGDNFAFPYGMVDNPYIQSQYVAEIDFSNNGHYLVHGMPRTGKTTFLQTCIMSIAKYYKPDEVNIYALDFDSWSLNWFSELPHICGVANDNDKAKIDKLLNRLSDELETRKKNFTVETVRSIEAYNQKAKKKIPHVVLVVDNLSKVFSMYPELESFFTNLVRAGTAYGIYLLATTGTTGGISHRITGNIKANIALRLKDASDYAFVVGSKTNNMEPENIEGRGMLNGTPYALEFQTALPASGDDDIEVMENMKLDISNISVQYSDFTTEVIRDMPVVIPYNSIDSSKVAMGLTVKDVSPVEWDVKNMPHYAVISHTHNTGSTNLMKVIIKQFYEKENADIVLYDNGTDNLSSVRSFARKYIDSVIELDDFIEHLSQELTSRKKAKDSGDDNFKVLLLAIDGYKTMFESITDESAKRLLALVRKGRGLGVYLLVSENAKNMSMLCANEPIMKNIVDDGVGILVGGSFYTHTVFKSDLQYLESSEELDDFHAYLVNEGIAIKFKAMYES